MVTLLFGAELVNPLFIIGGLVIAGAAVVAFSGGESGAALKGLPTDARFKAQQWKPGLGRDYNGLAYTFDGKPIGANDADIKALLDYVRPKFEARKASLPADASFHAGDKYSGEAYWWPFLQSNPFNTPGSLSVSVIIDEYGRTYDVGYGQAGMLANLWANPLFRAAVIAALTASGYGLPAYAAFQAYQLRGSDLTLKNVALQTARAYAVSYCGPACGAAFDLGVGVASGKPLDRAAEDAVLAQLTPEQRAAYDQGRQAVRELA